MLSNSAVLQAGAGEQMENCQNEDQILDVSYSCANIKGKVSIIWELKPVMPKRRLGGQTTVRRVPLRLVCVIDVSHSMAEPYGPDDSVTKLDKIKLFSQLLVRSIGDEDYLAIVSFGTKSRLVLPLTRMTPEAKEKAVGVIDEIGLAGVTNLGAGLCTAIDLFRTDFTKSRYFNDNIVLFTDGMANEGIKETSDMLKEIKHRIQGVKNECHYEQDYTIKLSTLGTGGFLPELIYHIGQAFSSDAFYYLDEETSLELNLMRPIILRQANMVNGIRVRVTTMNGVFLDKKAMSNEFEPVDVDGDGIVDESKAEYYIHDIASEMLRHLVLYLKLPAKHKKTLKNKDILKLEFRFRDAKMDVTMMEKTIAYHELPLKDGKMEHKDFLVTAQQHCRLHAQRTLNKAADFMKRLDRAKAKETIQGGVNEIREFCEYTATVLPDDMQEKLAQYTEPLILNLDYCDHFLTDFSVRWDDAWGRLKAMSSSIGREAPTASGVFKNDKDLFMPDKIEEKMIDLCARLREIYMVRGLSTETIDRYRCVIRELQEKLEKKFKEFEV